MKKWKMNQVLVHSNKQLQNDCYCASDEHDVPGTGAQQGGGMFGLGKGGLGGLGLGGPSPMTGASTANPFGSITPVSAASLPTGSSTGSLFQAPRGCDLLFEAICLYSIIYRSFND